MPVTVKLSDRLNEQDIYWLEHLIGRLYQKRPSSWWYADFQDLEMAEMVLKNLADQGYQVEILK